MKLMQRFILLSLLASLYAYDTVCMKKESRFVGTYVPYTSSTTFTHQSGKGWQESESEQWQELRSDSGKFFKARSVKNAIRNISYLQIADYITQCCSINAVSSIDEDVVGILAKVRMLINGIKMLQSTKSLLTSDGRNKLYVSNDGYDEDDAEESDSGEAGSVINSLRFLDHLKNFIFTSQGGTKNTLGRVSGILATVMKGYNIYQDAQISNNALAICVNNGLRKAITNLKGKQRMHYSWLTCNHLLSVLSQAYLGKHYRAIAMPLITWSELCRQKLMYNLINNKHQMSKLVEKTTQLIKR